MREQPRIINAWAVFFAKVCFRAKRVVRGEEEESNLRDPLSKLRSVQPAESGGEKKKVARERRKKKR